MTTEEQPGGSPVTAVAANRLQYHFIKSNYFRVICVEGVYGGLSPTGQIRVSVFNERVPLPQFTEHEIVAGAVGKEVAHHARQGIVREIEADLVMSLETAKALQAWLGAKIAQASELIRQVSVEASEHKEGA